MNSIKQKIYNFILSFATLLFLTSCSTTNIDKSLSFTKIAILLPKTGPDAEKTKEYISMIKVGLKNSSQSPIKITTYDSATPSSLNNALNDIIERGTDIIIGPIYTQPTKIVADKIEGTNIISISLSNNPSLAGEQLYIFGHAPMRQLQVLLNYSLDNNYKDYITLLPEGGWSKRTNKIISETIKRNAAKPLISEFYQDNNESSYREVIKQLSKKVDNLNENTDNLNKPVIILSDDNENLQKLLKILKSYQLDKKAILMSDNRVGFDYQNHTNMIYTGSMNLINSNFLKVARNENINPISFLHILSYDAGQMIGSYIGQKYNRNNFITKLNSNNIFQGLSGGPNFIDNIAQRKYQIIERREGAFRAL